ncbi:MAG TPA: iron-sulfur cluster insertion protein ErpA [Anaerolineae bacterium]|nr:iron-sulfur cluster insertion protein ErpA [Anaerolineae bacterium]
MATTLMQETAQLYIETPLVAVSPAAADKLQKLLSEKNIADYGLRVFVAGGGCSGLQYGMAFEKEAREFDTTVEAHGIRLYIDPTSVQYLEGASIDYVDNLMGGGFRIENPNAVSTCGCGHSFRTQESGASASSAAGGDGCGCQ